MAKEIRADAKLKKLPPEVLDELWQMRNPADTDDKALTYAEVQVELPRFGVTASKSTLSLFFRWLKQKREFEEATERAEQAKLQYLKANPEATPESLMAVGQLVFTNKSMQDGDVDSFVKLATLMERRKAREFDEKKFQASLKGKLEAGLDALYEEIKGNGKAEKIFAQLKETLVEA